MNNNYKAELDLLKGEIPLSEKPLIITEGKTDWKHLKAALQKLNNDYSSLDVEFFEYEEEHKMGSSALHTMIESFKKLPNNRKIIFVFDRDEENIVKIYGEEKYKTLGNNIYAFCISKIDEYLDRVSIEYYYPEEDRIKFDVNNRRLFSGTDFHKGTPNSKCGKYQTKKQDKAGKLTIIDEAVYEKLDLEMSKSIALSKNEFAENILNQKNGFETMNFENFRLILNVISDIVIS